MLYDAPNFLKGVAQFGTGECGGERVAAEGYGLLSVVSINLEIETQRTVRICWLLHV